MWYKKNLSIMAFPSTPLLDSQDDVDLALKGTGECFLLRDILPETVKGFFHLFIFYGNRLGLECDTYR